MIRLLLPFAALGIAGCAQFDAPPAAARATARTPAILGADKPIALGQMTVTATALPPR